MESRGIPSANGEVHWSVCILNAMPMLALSLSLSLSLSLFLSHSLSLSLSSAKGSMHGETNGPAPSFGLFCLLLGLLHFSWPSCPLQAQLLQVHLEQALQQAHLNQAQLLQPRRSGQLHHQAQIGPSPRLAARVPPPGLGRSASCTRSP